MDLTIPAAAAASVAAHADRDALVEGERRLSFREYGEQARLVARALLGAGIGPGDRVATWAPNSVDHAVFVLGVHLAGATLVPVNTRFKEREAVQVLVDARVRLVLTVDTFLSTRHAATLREAAGRDADLGRLAPRVVALPGDAPDGAPVAWVDLVGPPAPPEQLDAVAGAVGPDDVATILFTSGTTGRPKGAMLRHGAVVRGYREWCALTGMVAGDRVLVSNPFFHAFGLHVGLLGPLLLGATAYPVAVFDADEVLRLLREEQITYYPGPPTVFADLAQRVRAEGAGPLPALRAAVVGATVIPRRVVDDLHDVLGARRVHVPYGFTEASALGTVTRADDDRETVVTTAGRPVPGVSVVVRRPDGSEAATGETGEIHVDGYSVMLGYLDPATGTAVPRQGPLASGDLGHLDDRGNLVVSGRLKDVVVVGGFNVYPAEVEGFLLEHPEVAAAAVVGRPDARLGEVTTAFVVPRAGCAPDPDELVAWCRRSFAGFKVPREVRVVDSLPLNATGKVVKAELRALLPGGVGA